MNDAAASSPHAQPARQEECACVREFLRSVFHAPEDAVFIEPRVLEWKYFHSRPDCAWPDGRSFVYRADGEIAAHCAIWPLELVCAGERLTAMHLIDWAASPDHPGAGLLLYTTLAKQAHAAVVIGGAAGARKILARIGFQTCGQWNVYRRVLKPWRHYRSQPTPAGGRGWQLARLARDIAYCFHGARRQRAKDWTAEPVERFEPGSPALPSEAPSGSGQDWIRFERTAGFLNYILACPAMPWRAFVLRRAGEVQGYAVVNFVYGEARVADLWVHERSTEAWRSAVLTASTAAVKAFDAEQLLISAASPFLGGILRDAGFLPYSSKPVFFSGAARERNPDPENLHLSFLDSDAFLLP